MKIKVKQLRQIIKEEMGHESPEVLQIISKVSDLKRDLFAFPEAVEQTDLTLDDELGQALWAAAGALIKLESSLKKL